MITQCDIQWDGCGTIYQSSLETCPKCGASTTLLSGLPKVSPLIYIYDIETYPNIFTCAIYHLSTGSKWMFEISHRKDQTMELCLFLNNLIKCKGQMVGFNNVHFDYPVIHYIYYNDNLTVNDIYQHAMSIISSNNSYQNMIWDKDRIVDQIDLFKLWHFDNQARSTSLKALEFQMRLNDIQDLPFPVGKILTNEEQDQLIDYNWYDIEATALFYTKSLEQIKFREIMSGTYGKIFLNSSDAKIGSEVFKMKLNQAGIRTHQNKNVLNTIRTSVNLSECIPDYIKFNRPEFNDILNRFKATTLYGDNVKALFKNFSCIVDELEYVFGSGGMHGCRVGKFEATDDIVIQDIDVGGMYPSIIIENGYYPEHLGKEFSPIFKELVEERKRVGKKTVMGAGLKIAANGTYGNLGNKYSYLYDLKCMLSVTLTGQLVLLMIIEKLLSLPGLKMLQANTDGVTYLVNKIYLPIIKDIIKDWENTTGLEMEDAFYSRMWLADVNNYIAEFDNNSLKLKGRYAYDLEPHKDASALIIPMAAKAHMVNGSNIEEFIQSHKDPYDFCLRAKVPKSNKLVMRWKKVNIEIPMQKITRYFISKKGGSLIKIAPARGVLGQYKRANSLTDNYFNSVMSEIGLGVWDERIHTKNKSVYQDNVETGINSNELVTECNNMKKFNWNNLDYNYYIQKAKELIIN